MKTKTNLRFVLTKLFHFSVVFVSFHMCNRLREMRHTITPGNDNLRIGLSSTQMIKYGCLKICYVFEVHLLLNARTNATEWPISRRLSNMRVQKQECQGLYIKVHWLPYIRLPTCVICGSVSLRT